MKQGQIFKRFIFVLFVSFVVKLQFTYKKETFTTKSTKDTKKIMSDIRFAFLMLMALYTK
jgi:hypothetical protein